MLGTIPSVPAMDVPPEVQKLIAEADEKKNAGEEMEAIAILERGLEQFVSDGKEDCAVHTCAHLATLCNSAAMNLMEDSKNAMAKDLLDKAELLTRGDSIMGSEPETCARLRAATLNNLGCFHKYRDKHADALACLLEALDIEEAFPLAAQDPASTLLNLCTVCSKLGDHRSALQYARQAVMEVESALPVRPPRPNAVSPTLEEWLRVLEDECGGQLPPAAGSLAVALHNMAVEMEHCGMTRTALSTYRSCLKVAEAAYGEGSGMLAAFRSSYSAFRDRHFPGYQARHRPPARPAPSTVKGPRTTGSLMAAAAKRLESLPHTVAGSREAKETAEFGAYMAAATRGEGSGMLGSTRSRAAFPAAPQRGTRAPQPSPHSTGHAARERPPARDPLQAPRAQPSAPRRASPGRLRNSPYRAPVVATEVGAGGAPASASAAAAGGNGAGGPPGGIVPRSEGAVSAGAQVGVVEGGARDAHAAAGKGTQGAAGEREGEEGGDAGAGEGHAVARAESARSGRGYDASGAGLATVEEGELEDLGTDGAEEEYPHDDFE